MVEIPCAGRDTLTPDETAAVAAAARRGGVILYPTDTLYGLGVDPGSAAALEALFRLKGRDAGKPVPVLLADASLVGRYASSIPRRWRPLMERCWPGPLTLLFPAREGLPRGVRSAAGKVALRVPGSALCRAVLLAAGGSLTGTSANPAGAGGTGDPGAARSSLGPGIDLFVNAGTLPVSPASTLLEMTERGAVSEVRAGALPSSVWRRGLGGRA
jgi:L-threonylcarbamoyladenylate synthase